MSTEINTPSGEQSKHRDTMDIKERSEPTLSNIVIRQMNYDDCDRVAELIYMLKVHQNMSGTHRCPAADDLRKEFFYGKKRPRNNGTFVNLAETSCADEQQNEQCSRIVGYMIYTNSYSIIEGRRLYITSFFIEEPYRRCRIGQRLFTTLVEHAHAINASRIDVPFMKDNNAGISFYKKRGAELADDEYQIYYKMLEKLSY